jgi:hypothetical protein
MDRRSSAGDAFVPRARKDPPNKPLDSNARQNGQETVSANTTSVALHSPDDLATFTSLVPKPKSSPPSTTVSPASPDNDLASEKDQSVKTQWAYGNKSYEITAEAQYHTSGIVNKGDEATGIRSLEVEYRGNERPRSHPMPVIHQPVPNGIGLSIRKIRESEEKRLEQAAVDNIEGPSMPLRSPESTVAFTPLTLTYTLVDPPLAYFRSRSSLELESWRRKPPDEEEGSRWLPYVVNERLWTSVVKHSPLHGTAIMLPNILSTCQGWVGSYCRSNVELDWRACCKPPDTLGVS